ncbi:hypothetical protein GCM10022220_09890 [Actinocatenispora rupis]|uniref:Uncharacterized protein n=1 Tax=Actinocatenispora rupis TaxID=519421 RepID=A0A8J3NAX3_9ACTN|nr:hypothetical protein Aru02nite_09010 [Actinocatenispora rupis]
MLAAQVQQVLVADAVPLLHRGGYRPRLGEPPRVRNVRLGTRHPDGVVRDDFSCVPAGNVRVRPQWTVPTVHCGAPDRHPAVPTARMRARRVGGKRCPSELLLGLATGGQRRTLTGDRPRERP